MYFDITSLQIMVGDENGDLKLDDSLSRAEFAAVMTRLLRYDDLAANLDAVSAFRDVKADDWFAGYVALVCTIGIMNGVSSDSFAPMEAVTYEQAVKTIVTALGYGIVANQNGGYPSGYIYAGASIGLTHNVPKEEIFTRGNLMQLLHNALDIDMMADDGYTGNYKIESGKTLRNLYLSADKDFIVTKERGIVTSNADIWLNTPNPSLRDDEVEIDDVKYRTGSTNVGAYIGQMIEFYAFEDKSGAKTLLSVKPTVDNTVTHIDFKDIINASISRIEYEQGQRSTFLNISGAAKIIKNGRRILTYTGDDLWGTKGSVTAIDNNGDRAADVVFVDEFVNLQVKEVKNDTIELAPGHLFENSRFLRIDRENKDVRYKITDASGNKITAADIPADSILSISVDQGREFYRITLSTQTAQGAISEISHEAVVIDGISYPFYAGEIFEFAPGDFVTAYLDYKGYVAGLSAYDQTSKYAYLLAAESGNGLLENVRVKMLLGSPLEFGFDKNEQNLDDTNPIPVINCKNSAVKMFDVANTLVKDGIQYKTVANKLTALTPGLYAYEVSSDQKISKLTSAQYHGGGPNMIYNSYDKTFAGNSFRTPFAIDENTVVINLPTNAVASDEDYFVPLQISNKASEATFFAEGYDYDENTKKVKVLVFHEIMRADDVLNIEEINIGMVERVAQVLDEEGESVTKFTILTRSGKAEYVARLVEGRNDVLKSLKVGDLIYYEVDLLNKLCNAQIIQSFAHGVGSWNDIEEVYGYVGDIEYDEIHSTGNLVTRLRMDTSKGEYMVDIQQRNTPPIFVFDRVSQRISTAKLSDILPGNDNEIVYILKGLDGRAKVCVIFKTGGGGI